MTNHVKTECKYQWQRAGVDWVNDDIRVLLVTVGSTVATDLDAQTIGDFVTLNEYAGTGYTSGGVVLGSKTLTRDTTNHRSVADAADSLFATLGAAGANCIGALVYKRGASLGASIPLAYYDQGGFPFNGNGSNVTLVWNAAGVLQIN